MNGLEFIKSLVSKPKIVITSAYRNYAIDAFEIDVTDYLLKPYSYKRFIKAITRVLSDYKLRDKDPGKEELFVYFDKAFHKININDIEYLKSEVDYVQIFGTHKKYLILDSLNHWETKLKDFQFVRVHRSYIVNLKKVHKIEGKIIHLNKITIPIGEKYKKSLFELIKD
jgi:DNA-binding LytR/AlgR family response regulator